MDTINEGFYFGISWRQAVVWKIFKLDQIIGSYSMGKSIRETTAGSRQKRGVLENLTVKRFRMQCLTSLKRRNKKPFKKNTRHRFLSEYVLFLQTAKMYLNQSLRKTFANFYLKLFQIRMTMLKSTP